MISTPDSFSTLYTSYHNPDQDQLRSSVASPVEVYEHFNQSQNCSASNFDLQPPPSYFVSRQTILYSRSSSPSAALSPVSILSILNDYGENSAAGDRNSMGSFISRGPSRAEENTVTNINDGTGDNIFTRSASANSHRRSLGLAIQRAASAGSSRSFDNSLFEPIDSKLIWKKSENERASHINEKFSNHIASNLLSMHDHVQPSVLDTYTQPKPSYSNIRENVASGEDSTDMGTNPFDDSHAKRLSVQQSKVSDSCSVIANSSESNAQAIGFQENKIKSNCENNSQKSLITSWSPVVMDNSFSNTNSVISVASESSDGNENQHIENTENGKNFEKDLANTDSVVPFQNSLIDETSPSKNHSQNQSPKSYYICRHGHYHNHYHHKNKHTKHSDTPSFSNSMNDCSSQHHQKNCTSEPRHDSKSQANECPVQVSNHSHSKSENDQLDDDSDFLSEDDLGQGIGYNVNGNGALLSIQDSDMCLVFKDIEHLYSGTSLICSEPKDNEDVGFNYKEVPLGKDNSLVNNDVSTQDAFGNNNEKGLTSAFDEVSSNATTPSQTSPEFRQPQFSNESAEPFTPRWFSSYNTPRSPNGYPHSYSSHPSFTPDHNNSTHHAQNSSQKTGKDSSHTAYYTATFQSPLSSSKNEHLPLELTSIPSFATQTHYFDSIISDINFDPDNKGNYNVAAESEISNSAVGQSLLEPFLSDAEGDNFKKPTSAFLNDMAELTSTPSTQVNRKRRLKKWDSLDELMRDHPTNTMYYDAYQPDPDDFLNSSPNLDLGLNIDLNPVGSTTHDEASKSSVSLNNSESCCSDNNDADGFGRVYEKHEYREEVALRKKMAAIAAEGKDKNGLMFSESINACSDSMYLGDNDLTTGLASIMQQVMKNAKRIEIGESKNNFNPGPSASIGKFSDDTSSVSTISESTIFTAVAPTSSSAKNPFEDQDASVFSENVSDDSGTFRKPRLNGDLESEIKIEKGSKNSWKNASNDAVPASPSTSKMQFVPSPSRRSVSSRSSSFSATRPSINVTVEKPSKSRRVKRKPSVRKSQLNKPLPPLPPNTIPPIAEAEVSKLKSSQEELVTAKTNKADATFFDPTSISHNLFTNTHINTNRHSQIPTTNSSLYFDSDPKPANQKSFSSSSHHQKTVSFSIAKPAKRYSPPSSTLLNTQYTKQNGQRVKSKNIWAGPQLESKKTAYGEKKVREHSGARLNQFGSYENTSAKNKGKGTKNSRVQQFYNKTYRSHSPSACKISQDSTKKKPSSIDDSKLDEEKDYVGPLKSSLEGTSNFKSWSTVAPLSSRNSFSSITSTTPLINSTFTNSPSIAFGFDSSAKVSTQIQVQLSPGITQAIFEARTRASLRSSLYVHRASFQSRLSQCNLEENGVLIIKSPSLSIGSPSLPSGLFSATPDVLVSKRASLMSTVTTISASPIHALNRELNEGSQMGQAKMKRKKTALSDKLLSNRKKKGSALKSNRKSLGGIDKNSAEGGGMNKPMGIEYVTESGVVIVSNAVARTDEKRDNRVAARNKSSFKAHNYNDSTKSHKPGDHNISSKNHQNTSLSANNISFSSKVNTNQNSSNDSKSIVHQPVLNSSDLLDSAISNSDNFSKTKRTHFFRRLFGHPSVEDLKNNYNNESLSKFYNASSELDRHSSNRLSMSSPMKTLTRNKHRSSHLLLEHKTNKEFQLSTSIPKPSRSLANVSVCLLLFSSICSLLN